MAWAVLGSALRRHGARQGAPAPAKEPAAQSAEMKTLVARFQAVMARIKALEASKAPDAGALKKATIAAGNLSTSPKGIVQANAALDQVEAQIEDAKLKLAAAEDTAAGDGPGDAKTLAGEARKRLKSLEDRGRQAIAADPRNSNAGWLTDAVGDSEARIVDLEQQGTQREVDDVRKQLDWLEESIERMEADAEADAPAGGKRRPPARSCRAPWASA